MARAYRSTHPRNPPEGYHAVTPWIVTRHAAELIDFLKAAFGAEELSRLANDKGGVAHAEVRIGDSVIMMFDSRDDWPDTPAFLRLYVEDADAAFKRAVAVGATPITKVTALAFGDRVGRVRDPFGNFWWLQSHVEDVGEDEMAERTRDRKCVAAMAYVQDTLVDALRREKH